MSGGEGPPRAPAGVDLGGVDLVVIGGGVLGSAIARVATAGGARVTVASRTQRGHAGWWRAFDVKNPTFPAWIPRDVRVVVAVGPAAREAADAAWGAAMARLIGALARGGRPVSLCGPIGDPVFDTLARGVVEARVVRLAPLFSLEDRVLSWAAGPLREGRALRVGGTVPASAPLWADDAARAVLSGEGDELTLRGPDRVELGAMLDALVGRYGGSWGRGWRGTPWTSAELTRARAAGEATDGWDDSRFGARLSLTSWIERLPGPRRRR